MVSRPIQEKAPHTRIIPLGAVVVQAQAGLLALAGELAAGGDGAAVGTQVGQYTGLAHGDGLAVEARVLVLSASPTVMAYACAVLLVMVVCCYCANAFQASVAGALRTFSFAA
jgi:hypothetical protein